MWWPNSTTSWPIFTQYWRLMWQKPQVWTIQTSQTLISSLTLVLEHLSNNLVQEGAYVYRPIYHFQPLHTYSKFLVFLSSKQQSLYLWFFVLNFSRVHSVFKKDDYAMDYLSSASSSSLTNILYCIYFYPLLRLVSLA